jgi:hypothetical protein
LKNKKMPIVRKKNTSFNVVPPWNPCNNSTTSVINDIPIDRRPLRLGLYLQNQKFSSIHSIEGTKLLKAFKYFRKMGWTGNALFGIATATVALPELLDFSLVSCQIGLVTGGTTAIGATGIKFLSKISMDEIESQMENKFNDLKESIILHNKPLNIEKQIPVPYLTDPSL